MEIKNSNLGTINAENANIGDTYNVTNIIEGLSFLLSDYQAQIKRINSFILEFKPKTALDLLIDLEKRIKENNIPKNSKIESKILFLKSLCKSELPEFTKEESALDFIKAYNLNIEDDELKTRACIEYLNIDNKTKSVELADDILTLDNYNLTAWYVKTITSNNIASFLPTIPKIVFNNYNFHHYIIYHIFDKKYIKIFDDLKGFGLQLSFDFDKYKVVTFENKQTWIIGLDLLISSIINKSPYKYISGENFIIENDPEIIKAKELLEIFINSLESTEISETTKHQKFYLYYLNYLSTNKDDDLKSLDIIYNQLEKPHWIYISSICQILNHKKDFQKTLEYLKEYETLKGELHSEFYLFKSIGLHFLMRNEDIELNYNDYLNSINTIDEKCLFTLLNVFDIIRQHTDDKNKLEIQLEKILEKKFIVDDLKILLKASIEIRYIGLYNKEAVFSSLNTVKNNNLFDNNCRNLIAENLDRLGKPLDALNFMDTYIDKSIVSESLKLYIYLLHSLLRNKEDTPKGKGNELIELLKFWRVKSFYIDENLLRIEHDLYVKINDLDNLEQIDQLLYRNFPENIHYLYFYLAVLEKKSNFDEIKELSISIPSFYEEESMGIAISGILLRNKNNTKKGFEILYNLAIDHNNTEARINYFGGSSLFNEYFENYDTVSLGHWVSHSVDGKIEKIKIVKSEGIQRNFLGKIKGDLFTNINPLTNNEIKIEIIEIFNDALNLFRDIANEAHNPINELGFQSLEIPSDINDFPKFLVDKFGTNGTNEKTRTDNLLNEYYNYRIGFLIVVSAVFKSKFIDAYLHLTGSKNSKFITIPHTFTADINIGNQTLKFVLDFSSLMLFYYLEKELNFKFIHKFIVTNNMKFQIENEIAIVINSPESTLSVNITSDGIEKYIYPEGINNKRIEFLQSIIEWINNNCEIDLVAEKLDVILKLPKKDGELESNVMSNLIDSLHLSIRENHRFISSDVSNYLFDTNKINNNFLNPEKYLLTYYPEKCNSDFYRFLLKSNYVGIDISFKTLKDEFIAFIRSKENYYLSALENIQFSVNNNPNIIIVCVQFLKYLYLKNSMSITDKNSYASEIFRNSFYGMPIDLINIYQSTLMSEFKLLADYNDEVFKEFMSVKRSYIGG